MENYRILKLKNGDSVIAGFAGVTENNTIILERPMQFKTMTVMDNNTMGIKDFLFVRNWAEYSVDKFVEISNDSVLAILKPDERLTMVYDLEKKKEDDPSSSNPLPLTDNTEDQMQNMQKMNIQLQLPPEASEQFLQMLGIEFADFEDEEDDEEDDDIDDLDLEDDADLEPPKNIKKPKVPKPSKNQKQHEFGNNPDDWSPDPTDYLK